MKMLGVQGRSRETRTSMQGRAVSLSCLRITVRKSFGVLPNEMRHYPTSREKFADVYHITM